MLNRLKIDRAMELLGSTNAKLHRVAGECGFTTASNLCRAFKALKGHSPTRWRREMFIQYKRARERRRPIPPSTGGDRGQCFRPACRATGPWNEPRAVGKVNKRDHALSQRGMTRLRLVVQWREGLHLRRAVRLVQVAKQFRSTLHLRCGDRIADLRSILGVVALCATMGTGMDLEAAGDDEQDAVQAIEQVFQCDSGEAPTTRTV